MTTPVWLIVCAICFCVGVSFGALLVALVSIDAEGKPRQRKPRKRGQR